MSWLDISGVTRAFDSTEEEPKAGDAPKADDAAKPMAPHAPQMMAANLRMVSKTLGDIIPGTSGAEISQAINIPVASNMLAHAGYKEQSVELLKLQVALDDPVMQEALRGACAKGDMTVDDIAEKIRGGQAAELKQEISSHVTKEVLDNVIDTNMPGVEKVAAFVAKYAKDNPDHEGLQTLNDSLNKTGPDGELSNAAQTFRTAMAANGYDLKDLKADLGRGGINQVINHVVEDKKHYDQTCAGIDERAAKAGMNNPDVAGNLDMAGAALGVKVVPEQAPATPGLENQGPAPVTLGMG